MNCQFCGGEVGIIALVMRDPDFCSPLHRAKFRARLSKGLRSALEDATPEPPLAGSLWVAPPCDAETYIAFVEPLWQEFPLRTPAFPLSPAADWLTEAGAAVDAETEATEVAAPQPLNAPELPQAEPAKPFIASRRETGPSVLPAPSEETAADRAAAMLRRLERMRWDLQRAAFAPDKYAVA
jgi:hypothetical protein